MRFDTFLLLSSLAFVVACEEGPSPASAEADATARTSDGVAPTAAQIGALLGAEDTFQYSPLAKKWGANEMDAKVEVVTLPLNDTNDPQIGSFAQPRVLEILSDFVPEPEYATDLFRFVDMGGDVHHALDFGWDEAATKSFLLKLVRKQKRKAVEELILDPDLNAYYYQFQIWDVGAEFIGHDLIIIVPMTWDDKPIEAVVVHTSYVHA